MKKLKYLLFTGILFMLSVINVSAADYSTVVSDTATKCDNYSCDVPAYTMIVSSDNLDGVTRIDAYSPSYGSIYVDDEYQIYSEMLY